MRINHHPVVSSNLNSAGYDKESKTLEITFKNGKTYSYSGITKSMYEGIFKANSPGRFVRSNIIKGGFKFSKK